MESWGPLARGGALEEPILRRIADQAQQIRRPNLHTLGAAARHRASAKSAHKNRIRANLDVFDFSLDGEDMALIETMDAPGNYSIHPDYLSEE